MATDQSNHPLSIFISLLLLIYDIFLVTERKGDLPIMQVIQASRAPIFPLIQLYSVYSIPLLQHSSWDHYWGRTRFDFPPNGDTLREGAADAGADRSCATCACTR
jgi:hypothetical protein